MQTNRALALVVISIIILNTAFYIHSTIEPFSNKEARKDASGFSFSKGQKFIYFYYYTGYFPLATVNNDLEYSIVGADYEIQKNGKDLIMEYQHWSRLGENARIFAFLPNAYLDGSPRTPSIKLFNAIVFVLSLIVLYFGFWRIKFALQGLVLVIMINSTPFYLYEVYSNQNIFALLGSVFFLVLGLNISYLFSAKINYKKLIVTVIVSGIIIGFFSEIRNEVSIVIVSLLLIIILAENIVISIKLVLPIFVFLSFYGTKQTIRSYFNSEFDKTKNLVIQNNGHVYNGKRISGHKFWHPVFCGLGDFDTKYGYKWDDRVAYSYAVPILREKYNINVNYSGNYYTDDYYDKDKLYYIKFDEIEEYEEIVKNKVHSDIFGDPYWYIQIIYHRIIRTLNKTLPIEYIGWIIFPLGFYLIRSRKWNYFKLLMISLPLSATSILIYSGKGITYNSVYGYIIVIILISIFSEKMQLRKRIDTARRAKI
jgi:hypothetical protein